MAGVIDLDLARWQLIDPEIPYVRENAFATYWRAHPEIGSPVTGEFTLDDMPGFNGQAFVAARLAWSAATGVIELLD